MSDTLILLAAAAAMSVGGATWSPCTPMDRIVSEMTQRHGAPTWEGDKIIFLNKKDRVRAVYTVTDGDKVCKVEVQRLLPVIKE
jgi:hypothetical protein